MGFVFQHEIVAGTVLVVEAVESQNYAGGVSGWIIRADGTAEFLDVIVRGSLRTGSSGQYIGINIPGYEQRIAFFSGSAEETLPGIIKSGDPFNGQLFIDSPNFNNVGVAELLLESDVIPGTTSATLTAGIVDMSGNRATLDFIGGVYLGNSGDGFLVVDNDVIVRDGEIWHVVGAAGEPAFAGNWAVSGGFTVGFYRDATGRAQLRGRCLEAIAASATIFTLPTGYRPSQQVSFPVKTNNDGGTVSWLTITTAGAVTFSGNLAQGRVQTILDSVSFPTF